MNALGLGKIPSPLPWLWDLEKVLAKADKGEILIILNGKDYVDRMMKFLDHSNATLIQFSINSSNETIRTAIRSSTLVIPEENKDKSIYMMNFCTPRLYGQLKIHKPDLPIRPVIAGYFSPSVNLGKFLASTFRSITGFHPHCGIQNSPQLANQLHGIRHTPICNLVKFGVISMFALIPVPKAIDAMYEILVKAEATYEFADEFEKLLLHLCR